MTDDEPLRIDGLDADTFGETLDSFGQAFFVVTAAGSLRQWNDTFAASVARDGAALAGTAIGDLVVPTDRPRLENALAEVRDHGTAAVETAFAADGDSIPQEFRLALAGGDPVAEDLIAAVAIGDAKGAVERVAILDRMTDAFFAVDEDWRLTYVNEQAGRFLAAAMAGDRDPDALEGLHLWEEIPDIAGTEFYEQHVRAMETQQRVTFEAHYDPLDTWFEVRAYPSETGQSVYFRDVTDRRERERHLREHQRVLQDLYDVTSDPALTFEEQVEALLAIGCEAIGIDYGSLSRIEGDDYRFEIVCAPDDLVEAGDEVPLEATNCERTAAQEERLVVANVAEERPDLTDRAGYTGMGISCYLGVPVFVDEDLYGTFCFYDVGPRQAFTDWEVTLVDLMGQWVSYELTRQDTREQLERQNEQLDRFASIVSHDLRNPLSVLDSSLELARETGAAEHFDRADRAVDQMTTIVDDVLTLARAGDVIDDPEPVDLATLARTCWESGATADATLDVRTSGAILADESRLQQLLANLFRNAVEHGGDAVTVTVRDREDGFAVADDGEGVGDVDPATLFDADYSPAEEGTGFGLSIVAEIAGAHGWTVAVEESPAGGACFVFGDVERA
jgi:PAS domain-containing protein/anti-sigma regulatory factor (Ser/Thr protein kinase)